MDATYAVYGTKVVVGFHRPERYDERVNQYVCRITHVIRADDENRCHVFIDNGFHRWPIQDMILASDIPLLTPEQRARIK